nr:sulfatase-like hydrolase/transferase [Bacteroidota bacterium]
RLVSFYFQGESFNERFFFHFNLNSIIEAGNAFFYPIIGILIYLCIIICLCWIFFSKKNRHHQEHSVASHLFILALVVFVLEPDISKYSAKQLSVMINAQGDLNVNTIAWEELGLHREALLTSSNNIHPGKNLVFIYLESLEKVYTDERIFPGLTPNLNKLSQSGLTFNHMVQTEGTGWTIGGMVASQCGTPLLYGPGLGNNDILQNGFLNKATCLGDILKLAGYYQVFLGGASAEFAGKGSFLTSHGYDEVKGKKELSPHLEDSSYISGWGLYDDSLFAIAEEKFKQLAQQGQPFNLTLLTLDTHHPIGNASRSCPSYKALDNSILDAVHCSDFLVNQFIEALSTHPAWKNTLIVLFSDHLAMRNIAQDYYPDGYDRQLLFIVLNAGSKGKVHSKGFHMDIAPTLLHLLGVRHDRRFLAGENLMDAARQVSAINYLSLPRLDALKFINNNLLTEFDNFICKKNRLVDVHNNHLRIGEQEIVMRVSGQPISFESLEHSHGVLTSLDDEGKIRFTITVNLENLPHVLYQFRDTPFLLIAKTDHLPEYIKTGKEKDKEISVLMGSLQGKIDYLGGSNNFENLSIENSNCTNELRQIVSSIGEDQSRNLLDICSTNDSGVNFIDSITGDIHLLNVAHENERYSLILSNSVANQYSAINRVHLGSIVSNSNKCHAYFGNSELIIPSLEVENKKQALRLKLVSGTDWQFNVVEKQTQTNRSGFLGVE